MKLNEWAEKEIELACKKENPNWDGKSFDYGCACYQSALKAYKSMLDDGHSGFSWGLTSNILKRLLDDLPLTPIKDEDFVEDPKQPKNSEEYLKEHNLKSDIQCPRMSRLFRQEHLDGTIKYSDVGRDIFIDTVENIVSRANFVSKIIDELYPIKMPYYPPLEKYKVYGKEIKIQTKKGTRIDYFLDYLITPKGERISLNKTIKGEYL